MSDDAEKTPPEENIPQDAPAADASEQPEVPPASFPILVTTISTQAMIAMGQIHDPSMGEKPVVRLDMAKHFVDMLDVLAEKTKGNLTTEEDELMQSALSQMRMLFVNVQGQSQQASE